MGFDDEGFAFVAGDGLDSEWLEERFRIRLYKGDGAGDFKVEDGDEIFDFAQWKHDRIDHKDLRVESSTRRHFTIRVSCWVQPQSSCRLWWHLPSLYEQLGLSSHHGKAGRWTSHSWAAWVAFAATLGLAACHLRQQVEHGDPTVIGNCGGVSDRVLPEKAMSSHMLVACLSTWSAACRRPGRARAASDQQTNELLLMNLLEKVGGEERLVLVFCDEEAQWKPPSFPIGRMGLVLRCSGGLIDLRPLVRFPEEAVRSLRKAIPDFSQEPFHLSDVLRNLAGKDCAWIFRQLVWFAGSLVDEAFSKEVLDGHATDAVKTAAMEDKRLVKYWLGCSEKFNEPKFVSMTMDLARIGQKKRAFGIIALPDNSGCVYPPQDLHCAFSGFSKGVSGFY